MSLGVIREWSCLEHGEFEGSHPICPEHGCRSRAVVQEFRTAPTIGSRMVRQHHAGLKRSSEMMKISNFRSARAGEAAHGGNVGQNGQKVLWGDDCRKVLGRSFAELTTIAHKPLVVQKRDGSGEMRLDRNNAMREVATESGLTQRRVAKPGELRVLKGDARSEPVAKLITT